MCKFQEVIDFIKSQFSNKDFIPLHEPLFCGNEKKYLLDCIDSTFVSSVGKYVDLFEEKLQEYTNAKRAVVTVNGTSALHTALTLCGVTQNDEVITQPLTFVATCNAISYIGAKPIFIDVDLNTMGLCPEKLETFLNQNTEIHKDGYTYNRITGKRIKACVPMHTFGHPCKIDQIVEVCNKYTIDVIEDAAESLGSFYKEKHTGLFGKLGILSFNGNKTITTGGGGAIITNDFKLGEKAKHITTTAKLPHKWEFNHNMVGFNYRMPNINAALGCAQIENLDEFITSKRKLAQEYNNYFTEKKFMKFFYEPEDSYSNYWLNALIFEKNEDRDNFLSETNNNGVMTRPAWNLMNTLTMYKKCFCANLLNSQYLADRIVNIPSGIN